MATFKGIDREGQEILLDEDTVAAAQNNLRLDPRSGVQAITSDDLISEDPINIPPAPATSGAGEEISTIAEITTKRRQEAEKARQESQEEVRGTIEDIIGVQESVSDLEQEAGIPTISRELDELDSTIEAKQHALRRRLEELDKNPQGLFGGALEQEKRRITREANREIADLSIIRNAADRRLTTAQNLVQNKIKLQLEPLKLKLDYHKDLLEENRDFFDDAFNTELQQMIKKEDREYKEEQSRLQTLESTKLDILSQAVENGAPVSVLTAIQMAETPEDSILAAGRFGQDMPQAQGLSINDRLNLVKLAQAGDPQAVAQLGFDPRTGGIDGGLGVSPEAEMVLNNPSLLEQYTPTERGRLLNEIARAGGQAQTVSQESTQRMVANALDTINNLEDIDTLIGGIPGIGLIPGISGEATGIRRATGFTGVINPLNLIPGTAGRDAKVILDTLKAQLTIPQLEFARGLGRMSNEQFRTLKEASQSLDVRLSTDMFVQEVDRIKDTLLDVQAQMKGRGGASLQMADSDYEAYLEAISQ